MWQGPNGGHNRIVQSPGFVTILHEEYLDRRIIPVDGRAHGSVRQWFGNAVGKWEGDTLRGRHDQLHRPHQLRVGQPSSPARPRRCTWSERFTRTGANSMDYRITVEDPATFEQPWTAEIPITRLADDTQIYEYACHEGNYAMTNLLAGGRVDAAKKR